MAAPGVNVAAIVLTSKHLRPPSLYFELQDGFSTGYENEWRTSPGRRATHYRTMTWRSGKVKDFSLELDLAVGVQAEITTPGQLQKTIEWFYDAALPVRKAPGLVGVTVVGPKGTWYSQQCLIESVNAKWMGPYDVDTGQSMRCQASLNFKPFYGRYRRYGVGVAQKRLLPKRPWKFFKGKGLPQGR